MITPEEIEILKETLGKLTHYKEDDLVSRLEWGAVTFEDSRGDINLVQFIAADLESMPLNFLTTPMSQAIRRAIGPAVSVFADINDFTTTTGDVSGNRKNIANELRSVAEELYQKASPWIYLAYKQADTAKNIQQLNDPIKEAETMLENAKTSILKREIKQPQTFLYRFFRMLSVWFFYFQTICCISRMDISRVNHRFCGPIQAKRTRISKVSVINPGS